MTNKNFPITKPYLGQKEKKAVLEPLESGWLVQGEKVAKFEQMLANYIKTKHAVAVNSCTSALHLGLIALGINQDDEVILPDFTFIATANVIEHLKAKPVLVDIDLDTFNIDTKSIESKITKKTKAIIPVHLFGLCANIDEIIKIADKYKLYVIEDAACALGAFYKNRHAGVFGDIGCFSFHPRKIITTGEGGLLVTDNLKIANMVRSLRSHGADLDDYKRHKKAKLLMPKYKLAGFNYRLTDIQAAIGIEQFKRCPDLLKTRIKLAENYDKLLKEVRWLKTPIIPKDYIHSYQAYVCRLNLDEISSKYKKKPYKLRGYIMEFLAKHKISTRQGTQAIHRLDYYKNKYKLTDKDFSKSSLAEDITLALPLYNALTFKDQIYIKEQLKKIKI